MRKSALTFALFVVVLVAGSARAANPLTSQPLEDLQEKGNAAMDFVQDENAELAGAAYRLQTIVLSNGTVPDKISTLANSTRSAFDAALNRLRSLKLRPEQTAVIYRDLLAQYKCVTTPAEWVAAFKANALVCASDDLVLRLQPASSASEALKGLFARTSSRAATFWSGADALAKYSRISFPSSLGDNIPQFNNPYFNQTYESAGFAGIRNFRNGQGLVNNIGFSATDWSTTNTYLMGVFSKAAVRAAMRSDNEFYQKFNITSNTAGVQAFWQNAKAMFEIEFAAYNLQIPQVAIDILSNTTFADLTGCGAQCSYAQSVQAPSSCFTNLVYPGVRSDNNTCLPPSAQKSDKLFGYDTSCGPVNQTTGWTLVSPTSIDATQAPCSPEWLNFNGNLTAAENGPGLSGLDKSIAVVKKYQEFLATTQNAMQQALLTRAMLLQSSMGNFNTLFSGNGFTATGVGGVFMPTSTEYLFTPFNATLIPPGKGFDSVAFCLNGVNGGLPSATGTCTQLTPAAP